MKIFDVYSLFDIEPERAEGAYVYGADGTKYLDFYGGHAVISIGHSHPHFVNKLSEQLSKIVFYSNSVKIPQQEELAEKISALSACEDYALFLCNSGAEANENALKIAAFETGRKQIVAFKGSFHGRTSLAVAATDNDKIHNTLDSAYDICFAEMNIPGDELDKYITKETAAVMIEGMQGVAGIYEPNAEFLKLLREKCDQNGAVLILDEVQSGCGRTGKYFAHQHSGIKPDIITMAKGIGNGFPMAGVLISNKITPVKGRLGTTFGGGYLACTAGIAVADVILSEKLMDNALNIGNYLIKHLQNSPMVREIRGKGLMLGLELDCDAAPFRKKLLNEYKIFTGSSNQPNTVRLLPPLNITREHADIFINSFNKLANGS